MASARRAGSSSGTWARALSKLAVDSDHEKEALLAQNPSFLKRQKELATLRILVPSGAERGSPEQEHRRDFLSDTSGILGQGIRGVDVSGACVVEPRYPK
jgi:hypothetical protein